MICPGAEGPISSVYTTCLQGNTRSTGTQIHRNAGHTQTNGSTVALEATRVYISKGAGQLSRTDPDATYCRVRDASASLAFFSTKKNKNFTSPVRPSLSGTAYIPMTPWKAFMRSGWKLRVAYLGMLPATEPGGQFGSCFCFCDCQPANF